MRLILPTHDNVYRHLAAESYFLKHAEEPILMLWFSSPSIVCGKHQNLGAEVDYRLCRERNIHLARRISGGGTVYHDLGNLNFSFIQALPEGLEKAIDYKRYLEPMRQALRALSIETTYSYKDDLLLNDLKISGNAQHIDQRRKWALHHGTLLYSADLGNLSAALHTRGHYEGKGIASRPSPVVNIQDAIQSSWSPEEFRSRLAQPFKNQFGYVEQPINSRESHEIEEIMKNTLQTEAWILGYSPSYRHCRTYDLNGQPCDINLQTERGVVASFSIDCHGREPWKTHTQACLGKPLSEALLAEIFDSTEWASERAFLEFI
jgi:lipoate-protein ligase A